MIGYGPNFILFKHHNTAIDVFNIRKNYISFDSAQFNDYHVQVIFIMNINPKQSFGPKGWIYPH